MTDAPVPVPDSVPEPPPGALAPLLEEGEAGGFTIRLPAFEGPLDLLLHLIRKHELDLFDIPIHFITAEYLKYLQMLEELDVTLSSEFLVMAATLVHIKSQMLLPSQFLRSQLTDAEYRRSLRPEDPRYDLVQALAARQAIEAIAEELAVRDQWSRAIYVPGLERDFELEGLETEPDYDLEGLEFRHLLTAFQRVLARERAPEITLTATRLPVSEVMREIRHLRKQGQLTFSFRELISPDPRGYRIVAVFLALLELARQGRLRLYQSGVDDDIGAEWEDAPSAIVA